MSVREWASPRGLTQWHFFLEEDGTILERSDYKGIKGKLKRAPETVTVERIEQAPIFKEVLRGHD